jgi:hypothetical protein
MEIGKEYEGRKEERLYVGGGLNTDTFENKPLRNFN